MVSRQEEPFWQLQSNWESPRVRHLVSTRNADCTGCRWRVVLTTPPIPTNKLRLVRRTASQFLFLSPSPEGTLEEVGFQNPTIWLISNGVIRNLKRAPKSVRAATTVRGGTCCSKDVLPPKSKLWPTSLEICEECPVKKDKMENFLRGLEKPLNHFYRYVWFEEKKLYISSNFTLP